MLYTFKLILFSCGFSLSFHNLILAYSPRRVGYKHDAYVARVQLAYLDHNHTTWAGLSY